MVTSEQIVAAADTVARRDGLNQLTVRRLCTELGVTAPAIYRHFPTKDLIVDRVIDEAIGRIDLPAPESGDWIDRLRRCFVSTHDVIAPYGGLAARMGQDLPHSPSAMRNNAFLTALLADAGLDEQEATSVTYAVFVFVWGHLLAADAASLINSGSMVTTPREQFLWGLDRLLGSFRQEFDGRYPDRNLVSEDDQSVNPGTVRPPSRGVYGESSQRPSR